MFADCACGTRGRGVPEGDGLPLVKAGPRGMGACIPRRCVCMYTHAHAHMHTHSHVHTHTPNTWTCTHTIFNPTHSHCQRVCTRAHMYTHSHTKHLDIASYTLPTCFHIAPPFTTSGKINLENAVTRWKWGVGRLIAECTKTPIVIPVWHVGMEDILPTRSPYIPQLFKVRAAKHIQDVVPHLF